jgi:hypothetical protein
MPDLTMTTRQSRGRRRIAAGVLLVGALLLSQRTPSALAFENPAAVNLGSASTFTVLAGATVTNTGPTVISAAPGVGGNLGVSPGSAVTGFGPGVVTPPGAIHAGDSVAAAAVNDASAAYTDLQSRAADITFGPIQDIGGMEFGPGVYNNPSSFAITGTVTLNGGGNPDAIFIFQAGSTLGTAASSVVALINGAQACNVYWAVGSSATLGATSAFNGTIVALTSATVGAGANIQGRILAGSGDITGAVTLDSDLIHTPACAPISGVAQAPLLGRFGTGAALAAFAAGAAVLVYRRRMRPAGAL